MDGSTHVWALTGGTVCIDEVFSSMMSNQLQFNPAKTEVLWCLSARQQHQIPTGPARVGAAGTSSSRLGGLY